MHIHSGLHIQVRRVGREEAMKVAMLVGILMLNVIAGLYEGEWLDDSGSSDLGQVQVCDGGPPPPSWP